MWMPARLTVPPGRTASQRDRHQLARRREHDGPVARRRRELGGITDEVAPSSRARSRCRSPRVSTTTSQPQWCSTWMREVRRRAEAEQRDPVTRLDLGASQRAVPDHARAQQRRGLEVAEVGRAA